MTLTGRNGTIYTLDPTPIGSGGEGDIYRVIGGDGAKVAKLYKDGVINQELVEKLTVMINHPPSETVLSQVAWPLDLVSGADGKVCGFIMPELSINAELNDVYKYPSNLPISMHQKINIAQNICAVISEVHKAGYVFGDFNPRNIGLDTNTGLVSFLDTDTYHVSDGNNGNTYRCNVCASGYAAPELLERCSNYTAENPGASKNAYALTPLPTFTQETDNFALAIHIFKLLMNGYTPFGGIIEEASVSQSSPGVGDAAVRRNNYCFRPGYKHQSVAIPGLETLPDEIADLFTRAFIVGKETPAKRPDAIEWHEALSRYGQQLITCPTNPLHQYDRKNSTCPLCEADGRYTAVVAAQPSAATIKQTAYTPAATGGGQTTQSATHAQPIAQTSPTQPPAKKSGFKTVLAVVAVLVAIVGTVFVMNAVNMQNQPPVPVAVQNPTYLPVAAAYIATPEAPQPLPASEAAPAPVPAPVTPAAPSPTPGPIPAQNQTTEESFEMGFALRLYSDPAAIVSGYYFDLNYIEVNLSSEAALGDILDILRSHTAGGRYIQGMRQDGNVLLIDLIPFYYGSTGTISVRETLLLSLFSIPGVYSIGVNHIGTTNEDMYDSGWYEATGISAARIWEDFGNQGRIRVLW